MPIEDEPDLTATFGLHRGRRVLLGCLLVVLLGAGGYVVSRPAPVEVPTAPAVAVAEPEPDVAPLPPKKRVKSARRGVAAASPKVVAAPSTPPVLLAAAPVTVAAPVEEVVSAERGSAVEHSVPVEQAAPVVRAAPVEQAAPPEPPAEEVIGNGEHIARAIAEEKRAAVQMCFERELKQTPTLQGTVVVELDLIAPHRVNGVRVSDDLDRPAFTQCVSASMEHVAFSALNEDVSIRVPYELSAREK